MDAVEIEHLTKSYGRERGVVDLDLAVPAGTIFGFLGPNGAGKTTTIRILLDFLRPDRGTARVLGLDSRIDAVEVHRRVGYVASDPALYDRMTARALFRWLARVRGGVDPDRTAMLVERLGVELDRPIRSLSRGNRQKVALAQAFMHRPELLLLDEPTSGLDPLVQHEFQQLVRDAADEGDTVFLSSHVLDEVQHLCDRVGIIREGSLVAVETIAALRAAATREVVVRFAVAPPTEAFANVPGVRNIDVRGDALHCQLAGSADALVKAAARFDVVEFTSAPPDLDDLFLHYYEGGGRNGDGRR